MNAPDENSVKMLVTPENHMQIILRLQSALAARDATIARLQANLDRWSAIDEIMPPDYKDYWQGDGKPEAVIASILSLREREAMAWARVEQLQARLDAGPSDSFGQLIADAKAAAEKAMRKFPQPNYVMTKFAEEAGEVTRGCIHMAEKRPDVDAQPSAVRGEMVQTIAMLYRLWVEGDQVHGLPAIGPEYETAIRMEAANGK